MKKFLVMVLAMCLLVLSSCVGTSTPPSEPNGGDSSEETKEQVLVDDNNMKVSFIEIFEEPSISGAGYLRLKVENKTDKTVTVYPRDAYVNDTAITLGSGVHMKLAPGKNSQAPFIIFYGNLGITSKDEIKKIELRLTFDDENYDMIAETETLVIDLTK
mgnify:CR=1 FL=1